MPTLFTYLLTPMDAVMPPRRARGSSQVPSGDFMSPAAMLAAMQAMQQELAILRQAIPIAPTGAAQSAGGGGVPGGAVPAGAAQGGGAEVPLPVSGLSLMQWMGMKMDTFDGSGTPVEAVDWLTYVEYKMDVFEIVYGGRVRFGTQLLKGEAQIWWRGMQAAHSSSPGVLSWDVFISQFERRFYPVTFLEKMKIDLQSFKQEKKSVTEYEVGFNKMVRFVPHVAYNEMEKASQFHQGLKPSIRHALGAFPLVDFHTIVEQALGVEMQHQYTMESQKSLGVDQPRGQDVMRGNTGGPAHKRGKSQHQRHHPYRGKPSESCTSGGSTLRYRAVPKPGLGLVCFCCGEAHHRAEC
jgi:hypothetical protein